MRLQCPSCSSFNDASAAFCSQCGGALSVRGRRGRFFGRWTASRILTGMLLLLMGAVSWVAFGPANAPREDERRDAVIEPPAVSTPAAVPRDPVERDDSTPRAASLTVGSDEEPALSESEAARRIEDASVVLELRNEDGRVAREVPGVLVAEDGVVLCRLRPLLGAHEGLCRLPGLRQERREIRGISHFDVAGDLALLRVELLGRPAPHLEILDQPLASVFEPGDPLLVSMGHRIRRGAVADPLFRIANGVTGLRLEPDPALRSDSFLALDAEGSLVGLCRPLRDDQDGAERDAPLQPDRAASGDAPAIVVVPAAAVRPFLGSPARQSIADLTAQLYTGSFGDLVARAEKSFGEQAYARALEIFQQALDQAQFEAVEPDEVARVESRLRECHLLEARRLIDAGRLVEATGLLEQAIQTFEPAALIWRMLAQARHGLGMLRETVSALLEARALEPGAEVDKDLETVYLALASNLFTAGDERGAEAVLLEALQILPRSAALCLELAGLYERWNAVDDAIRLYRSAREIDPSLAREIDLRLAALDDMLRSRDAVIIRIGPESHLIETSIVLDERWEFPFIIDTGATHTTLPASFVTEMGYDIERAEKVQLRTAGGLVIGRRITLRSVRLQDYAVRNIEAIVLPEGSGLDSGLLGLNFLKFFKYGVDAQRGEFRLERR